MHVLNFLFDDRIGGPQRRVLSVARGLRERGVETTVVFPFGNGAAEAELESNGISSLRIGYQRPPALHGGMKAVLSWLVFLPRDIFRIYRFIKKHQPDIVHVNGAIFPAPAIAARLAGSPLLWHLNDTVLPKRLAVLFGLMVKMLASRIVVAAWAVADHYSVRGDKTSVLYAPVDIQQFTISSRRALDDRLSVGLIANWNPLKGIDIFLRAMAVLKERYNGLLEVRLAGSRLDAHRLYAEKIDTLIQELNLGSSIAFSGSVNEVPDFLASVDLLVMSSNSEACPMAVLEGMAARLPVVATDVGGVRELLLADRVEAGLVVPKGSAEEIAAAVLKLAGDRELAASMGENGRALAEKYFSLQRCVQKHLDCYNLLR